MPLLNAPLGMLIDLLLPDKLKLCAPVHLGKIKSTGSIDFTELSLSALVCADSFKFECNNYSFV